jgi:hypothetical protein
MALTKSARATLNTYLAEQNATRNSTALRTSKTWAPTAPMPEDPALCRWCGGQLRALVDGEPADYCQAGCQTNDTHTHVGHCEECRRQFETGRPLMSATFCHECDRRDDRAMRAAYRSGRQLVYDFKRNGRRGGYLD